MTIGIKFLLSAWALSGDWRGESIRASWATVYIITTRKTRDELLKSNHILIYYQKLPNFTKNYQVITKIFKLPKPCKKWWKITKSNLNYHIWSHWSPLYVTLCRCEQIKRIKFVRPQFYIQRSTYNVFIMV